MSQTRLNTCCYISHIKIITTRERQLCGVRRICKVHCARRLQREVREPGRSRDTGGLLSVTGIDYKSIRILVSTIISKYNLLISNPFP